MFCYLSTTKEFALLLKQSKQFAIYKFNPNGCRLSEETINELLPALLAHKIKQVYIVDVVTHTNLSSQIAELTGIKHESPQLLIFDEGKVLANRSHIEITKDFLLSHLGG